MEGPALKEFGKRLREAREAAEKRAGDVATHFGINIKTVYAWETGLGTPGAMRLRALCRLYGVSADDLLWGDADAPARREGLSAESLRRIGKLSSKQLQRLERTVVARLSELEADAADATSDTSHTAHSKRSAA